MRLRSAAAVVTIVSHRTQMLAVTIVPVQELISETNAAFAISACHSAGLYRNVRESAVLFFGLA